MQYIPLLCSLLSIDALKVKQLDDITPKPVQVKALNQEGANLQSGSVIAYDTILQHRLFICRNKRGNSAVLL